MYRYNAPIFQIVRRKEYRVYVYVEYKFEKVLILYKYFENTSRFFL